MDQIPPCELRSQLGSGILCQEPDWDGSNAALTALPSSPPLSFSLSFSLRMVFASGIFLYFFLPLFLGIYYTVPRSWRSTVIAVASYVFYGWWRPDFVILMWISTAVDYTAGRRITTAQAQGSKGKPWLWLSLIVNLGLLAYFKYANFGVDSLNAIFAEFGGPTLSVAKIILPVGISFYTFQTLSYTIDVYRGRAAQVRSFQDFMCYVALFPQLVAGPIVRYNTVAEQLHSRTHTLNKFYCGLLAFQSGMVKKILIADVLGGLADQAFAASDLSPAYAWLGALAYTFQIYFDFSGYSDMAIGLGLMIGFQFPINFNQPYRSISITDFWRRWHISLSSFPARLPVHPPGRKQKGRGAHVHQSEPDHAARRSLARGELDLHRLGRIPRILAGGGAPVGQVLLVRVYPQGRANGLDLPVSHLRLGVLPGGKHGARHGVLRTNVRPGGGRQRLGPATDSRRVRYRRPARGVGHAHHAIPDLQSPFFMGYLPAGRLLGFPDPLALREPCALPLLPILNGTNTG